MQTKTGLRIFGLLILTALLAPAVVRSQTPATSQAPQTTAIRAGRLFDPKSGTNLMNQVVIIKGDRVADVGPADRVQIPADAKVIDLSRATVLPGLIDGHVHLTDASVGLQHQMMVALYSATQSLNAGYTTLVPMAVVTQTWSCAMPSMLASSTVRAYFRRGLSSRSPAPEKQPFLWTGSRSNLLYMPTGRGNFERQCANWPTMVPTTSRS